MHNFSPADGADELWHVKLATGEVCLMTLDQLTEAYRRGEVDAETYVCREGSTDWGCLGVVATFDHNLAGRARVRVSSYPPPPTSNRSLYVTSSGRAPPSVLGHNSYAPFSADVEEASHEGDPFRGGRAPKLIWASAIVCLGALGFGAVRSALSVEPAFSSAAAAAPLPVPNIEIARIDGGEAPKR